MNRERFSEDLAKRGVRPGDLLMIRASLRKLGLAASRIGSGGAELLLEALGDAVGLPETSLTPPAQPEP